LVEYKIYFSNDIELEKIINLILHFENITIELVGSWVYVSGNTKKIKEKLKEMGFKWESKNPTPKRMEEIKSKYGSEL